MGAMAPNLSNLASKPGLGKIIGTVGTLGGKLGLPGGSKGVPGFQPKQGAVPAQAQAMGQVAGALQPPAGPQPPQPVAGSPQLATAPAAPGQGATGATAQPQPPGMAAGAAGAGAMGAGLMRRPLTPRTAMTGVGMGAAAGRFPQQMLGAAQGKGTAQNTGG